MFNNCLNRTSTNAAARLIVRTGLLCISALAAGPGLAAAQANSSEQLDPTHNLSQSVRSEKVTQGLASEVTTSAQQQQPGDNPHSPTKAKPLDAKADGRDSRLSGSGQIDQPGDADKFLFFAGNGCFSIEVSPATEIAQQALRVELYDAQGSLVANASPKSGKPAVLGGRLKTGQYYLTIMVNDTNTTTSNAPQQPVPQGYSVGGIVTHPGSLGAPEALALADYEVGQAPRPVKFDGTGIEPIPLDIVSWHWDFGDGNAALGATASHTYAAAGIYTATLTITDKQGYTDTDSVVIAVDAASMPVAPEAERDMTSAQPSAIALQHSELAISTGDWVHQ